MMKKKIVIKETMKQQCKAGTRRNQGKLVESIMWMNKLLWRYYCQSGTHCLNVCDAQCARTLEIVKIEMTSDRIR